ncbi:hypothetical protein ACJIZ3_020617 [Penstemon smallii]|uniref:Protein kinase domain-containing protein n=1 Tax=Penstemon smallii TaxID=265156 RepID=A0ABD3SJC7_9LAMI
MGILHPLYFFTLLIFSMIILVPKLSADPLSNALLSLKSEFTDTSNSLNNWLLPSEIQSSAQIYACSWTGVTCNENSSKIISLDLSAKNLHGSLSGKQFNLFVDLLDLNLSHNSFSNQLPSGIFNLTSLRSLDVSRNNFSGQFPKGISNLQNLIVLDAFSNSFSGPLPTDVSQLESLKVLNFAGSYFSGEIPFEYGSLKSLEFFHLAGNFLTGGLPSELGKLRNLSHMEIGYNSYEGGIPWQFGNMSELKYLDIADANLSGSIPVQISNLSKLESLFLFRNQIIGKIPWELSKILTLKSLDLSDNLLSGQIPDSFSELKNLKLLSLMYNDLSGSVPHGLAKLQELDTLLIWNNYFTGALPKDLGKYSELKHVDVSTNFFVGSIPPDICAGKELQKLILFSNNFTGGLFPSLSNCSSLVRLRLEDNSFSGEIPLQFGNLADISYVDLSRNKFVGGIPYDISQASNLQYFNVSNNPELGGIVPVKTWSLPYLQNFSMNSCGVSGDIPSFEYCKSLSVIELRMNNLSGKIPESVSNCKVLVKLDLGSNNLTGLIPLELAALPVISVLDLSRNHFIGPIPAKFGSLTSLKVMNVSYNDISGSIPPQKTFKVMDESAFLGNPKLCGAPLRPCHHGISNGLELGSRKAQKLAWILILCAVIVLFMVAAVFGVLHFKKEQWKMVAFNGLPQFTAKDVLRSFSSPTSPDSIGKVVLPTGITVSVKKIEWESKSVEVLLPFFMRMGNARHKNLTRLLGICYNNSIAYLLYDYLPNGTLSEKIKVISDWESKCRIVIGMAKALCFLHHDCFPAIPHGNLKTSNIFFDENMEPHLAEYGINSIIQSINSPFPIKGGKETGGSITSIREEIYKDVYNFGEFILEILTNGRIANAVDISREVLVREIGDENGNVSSNELNSVIEIALLCTRSRASERPTMQDVLKMLSVLNSERNGSAFGLEGHKA